MAGALFANEAQGAYPGSYYAASATLLDPFAALDGETRADICVIGGGYCGLSAALHLRRRGLDVALLDAHRVGWGASGRNGGQVGSGQRLDPDAAEEIVGPADARAMWRIAEDAKALVAQLIAEHDIDAAYEPGVLDINHRARFRNETLRYVERLKRDYDYHKARFMDREEARAVLGTDVYFDGVYDAGAGHLHPLRFALGLARAAVSSHVRIYERTAVKSITGRGPLRVVADRGAVVADAVLVACNGYHDGLERRIADRVLPINNYIIATAPLPPDRAQGIMTNRAAVTDTRHVVNYFRLSEDNRLLFGGRESYRYRFPRDIKAYVRRAMLRVFPRLKDVRIEYGWGGVVGITMNRMPHFERLRPGLYAMGGYSGHGVAMATMGGKLAADLIAGEGAGFDLMARAPSPAFPGGYGARRATLALGMLYYSLLDRL